MRSFLLHWPLLALLPLAAANAQFNPRATVQPPAPAEPAPVQQQQNAPADGDESVNRKSVAADPVKGSIDEFVGKKPAIGRTFVYPPGEGQNKFEAAGLEVGEDGYYAASAGNGFFMWFPPTAAGMPLTLTCSVKGPSDRVRFGNLSWILSGGGEGGNVGFRFGPGETDSTYRTNFTNGDASLIMMKLTVPPGSGLKECRVIGTFEQL
jgi:hypothetical protein